LPLQGIQCDCSHEEVRLQLSGSGEGSFGVPLPKERYPGSRSRGSEASRPASGTILGAIFGLLDATMIRIGNQAYPRDNCSYWLTTLRDRHVDLGGGKLVFRIPRQGR
jgi:DNA topoisomerase IB